MTKWYKADDNTFQIHITDEEAILRVYRSASMGGKHWVEKKSYRLDPELLNMETKNGILSLSYEGEPEEIFDKEADAKDREFEAGVDTSEAELNKLVCDIEYYDAGTVIL